MVPRTYYDRISIYLVQQITRANAPTGRLRRQGRGPQSARPPRPRRDTAGNCAASRDTGANHRRSHPLAGCSVPLAARCGKETLPESRVGPRTRYASESKLAMRAVTGPGLRLGFRQRPRVGRVECGFPPRGCAHLEWSKSEAHQPPLRGTQDTCDHLGRNGPDTLTSPSCPSVGEPAVRPA